VSAKVLFIGLDGAGKTSFLNFLEQGPNDESPKPSVGFDTKDVKYKGVNFSIYDVAGGEKVRDLWKHYYADTDAVVWIVDSAAPDRFSDAKNALQLALKDPSMKKNIPIFVAANKCDMAEAKGEDDIKKALDLDSVLGGRSWTIAKTNAKKGDGIYEGFKWLSEQIKAEYKKKKKEKS